MPLIVPIKDPFSPNSLPSAWAYCAEFSYSQRSKRLRAVFDVYRDAASAYAVPPVMPIKKVAIDVGPDRQPAQYGPQPLISPYVPPVYETVTIRAPGTNGPDDPGEYETVEVSPAQDPVYGPAPLLQPEIPSFDELVGANLAAFLAIRAAVDGLALEAAPEFAGGAIETPPGG